MQAPRLVPEFSSMDSVLAIDRTGLDDLFDAW